MSGPPLSRRHLLLAAGVAGAAATLGAAPGWPAAQASAAAAPAFPLLSRRFSTAMWDFSWLTRRTGEEAEYADWEAVLDGLRDRGYDNVRIDAFPHLVAPGRDGTTPSGGRFTALPQRPRFMWGNHRPVEIVPAQALVTFMAACRDRGITVGLSTWFTPDALGRRDEIVTPADFVRVWSATLEHVQDAGLLDVVAWVDLCNEFPLDVWAPGVARAVFGRAGRTTLEVAPRALPWTRTQQGRIQRYLTDAIVPLRERWPQLPYCLSLTNFVGEQMRARDVSAFDLGEVHCWLSDDPVWSAATLQAAALFEVPGGVALHARTVGRPGPARLAAWRDRTLRPLMRRWRTWAARNDLPLVTTEGWGPVNYADVTVGGAEWDWVKRFAELAVHEAVDQGWTGICTSNFAQPHHRGMWRDAGWHRELTSGIRAG
jgi:hypothetical protein